MTLLERIENHLKENKIPATTFGREAVGDPRFVLDLRNGRNPRRKTILRLETYLADCGSRGDVPRISETPATHDALPSGFSLKFNSRANSAAAGSSSPKGSKSGGCHKGGEGEGL